MLALDSGDKIRGDASAADVVDFTINGISGSVITQLADGQLPAAEGDLFTAGAAVAVASITLCNTDASARTVNLYLQPSGGTSRRIIAKDTSLGVGHSLHFSGDKVTILDPAGGLVTTYRAHTLGGAVHDADTLANLNTKVSDATLDDSSASRTPTAHKDSHVNSDSIRDATASLKGLATAAQITKLDGIAAAATKYPDTGEQAFLDADYTKLAGIEAEATKYPDTGEQAFLDADHDKLNGIEAEANVTDAENVAAAGAVMEADFAAKGDILSASADNTPLILTVGTNGQKPKAASGEATGLLWVDDLATIIFVIDGGGSAITTGQKGHLEIPFACTIQQVTMLADQSGSIVVDIWKDSYANFPPTVADTITASAKPTIITAQKSQDSTLTGWTTAITAGDVLAFNVDSVTTIERVIVSLKVKKI